MWACMRDLDVCTARRCWAEIAPDMPQPRDDFETLATLHAARTQTESIAEHLRVYSHEWLLDRGLPSGLPDHLRPKRERVYPRIVDAVGVSVQALSPGTMEYARAVERVMSDAVAECYADNKKDPIFVRARMEEARQRMARV